MSELAATRGFYSVRPTLWVDGREETALAEGLQSVSVHESNDGLYRCEATIGNWGPGDDGCVGFLYFDRSVLDFGKELVVEMGDAESPEQVFQGRIMALEGRFPQQSPPEILVLAEDRLQDLRMVRKTRSFENLRVADLVNRVAGEHGLRTDVSLGGPTFRLLTQVNQSDLAFLRDCLRRVDAELWIEGDTLYARARARRATEELSFTYGERLRDFAVTADLAQQRTAVVVSGWDVDAKRGIEERADEACLGSERGADLSGQRLLKGIFGERMERIVHEIPLNNDEARALAESTYRRLARRCLSGQAMCEGEACLRVGMHVCLEDLGPLFSGRYYVTEVTHTFDQANGYRTFFRVERPGLGRA